MKNFFNHKIVKTILNIIKWFAFWPVLVPYHILKGLGVQGVLGVVKLVIGIILIIYGIKLFIMI
jgi:hypothetical protein